MPITPDNLPDDLAALKRIIAAMAQDALTAQAEAEFGRSSEKLARETEQLELALEALEIDQAERLATASPEVAAAVETAAEAQKPARRPLPQHLPREDLRHPAPCTCPSCGSALRKIGDELTETLDYCRAGSRSSGTFARNYPAGLATRWWRRQCPNTRSRAAAPGRVCWPISLCRSTTTTCRFTAKPRSSPATG